MPTPQNVHVEFDDLDLQNRVERFILSRDSSAFRELQVEVQHGCVTLSGPVDSFYDKQVAITTCRRVAGVLNTIDNIDVNAADSERVRLKPR